LLRARLAKLEERGKDASFPPDLDAFLASDVDAAVNARRDRLAIEEEMAEVRQRIALVSNALSGPVADLRDAGLEEAKARARYEQVVEAIADPLNHGRAEETSAYKQRVTRQMGETLSVPGHPDWDLAVEALKDTAAASGVAKWLHEQGILAYVAGHPWALKAGGAARTLPDGRKVIQRPGMPDVVIDGAATAAQLAAAPGHAQVDTSPAALVMAQQWAATGAAHVSQRGLPGVHH
jgi:hypothetical protein